MRATIVPLFLDRGRPVDDDGQRRRAGLLRPRADQESLSIFRHCVHLAGMSMLGLRAQRGEEGLRHAGSEFTGRVDRHRHHGPIRSEVKQFLAVRSPDRLAPSVP